MYKYIALLCYFTCQCIWFVEDVTHFLHVITVIILPVKGLFYKFLANAK
jgi:hypothetical protein